MKADQINELAKPIILDGLKAGADHDQIRTQMVIAGVPFGKAMSIFTSVGIAAGLLVDPAVMTKAIKAEADKLDWSSCETWAHVEKGVKHIVQAVPGSNERRVIAVVKAFCKEEEIEIPEEIKKVGERKLGGKTAMLVFGVFSAIQKPTKQELYTALANEVKTTTVAVNAVKTWHTVCYALCNNMDIQETYKETVVMKFGPDVVEEEKESKGLDE